MASEITKAKGIVICAAIAPYREARDNNRCLISQQGYYIEVYVATSLSACEQRDKKGLYAKARRGELTAFTGIHDPYEPPLCPEITIDTELSVEACIDQIMYYLIKNRFLKKDALGQHRPIGVDKFCHA